MSRMTFYTSVNHFFVEFIVRVKGDVTDDMMDVVTAQCWAMGIILVLPIFQDRQRFLSKAL
jgi:hypothetical protein